MGSSKDSGKRTWARDEGIYRKASSPILSSYQVECTLCGKVLSASAFARASHGKTHVREGSAVVRTEFGYDGPRTVYEPATPPPDA